MNIYRTLQQNIITESAWDEDANGKKWEDYDSIVCPDGQVIDMVKLLDDQQRAKAALIHLAPMFGGLINNLHYVYTFRVQTQATDGYHLFVNPQFTYNMDLTEKCFVMAHELMHCLLNHMRRGKGHDHMRSNIAADYECNITLAEMELFKIATMKKIGAYVDEKYSGWGYEKIYDACSEQAKGNQNNADQANQAQKNSNQNQQSQSGKGNQSGSGSGGSNNQSQQSGNGGGQSQQYSADYKEGWKQAMEDYKKGKLKKYA